MAGREPFSLRHHNPVHSALRVKDATRHLLAPPQLGCQGAAGTCQALACSLPRAHATEVTGMRGHSKVTHWLHLAVSSRLRGRMDLSSVTEHQQKGF